MSGPKRESTFSMPAWPCQKYVPGSSFTWGTKNMNTGNREGSLASDFHA